MKPLEHAEDPLEMLRRDADTAVPDRYYRCNAGFFAADVDYGRLTFLAVGQGVIEQV